MSLRDPFLRGAIWYCEVDRQRVSLKTKDKGEALSRFAEIRKRYLEKLAGTPLHVDNLITIGEFAAEYTAWAEGAIKSKKTFKANLLALKKIISVTGRSLLLSEVRARHIDMLIARHRNCKSVSINNYIRHARVVMNKAVDWEYIPANPFEKIKLLRESKEPPRFIPPSEVIDFLQGIDDVDERRLLTAYIFSGRRRSELMGLKWEHIHIDTNEYYISSTTSKSNVSRRRPETLRACFQPLVTPGYHNAHSQKSVRARRVPQSFAPQAEAHLCHAPKRRRRGSGYHRESVRA